jgi:DNA-directed RNA polymerase subunit M/transcription elongation factor TFIIS
MPQTVQCPQCNNAVTVRDQAAGKRVKCPKCEKVFLAPGIAPSSNDDDDWLLLDHETAPTPRAETAPTTEAVTPNAASPVVTPPPLSSGDEAALAGYDVGLDDVDLDGVELDDVALDDGLDEFTSGVEPLPSVASGDAPLGGNSVFDDLPPIPPATSPAAAAEDVQFESEYRVKCNVCGSTLYAKAEQQGKSITCSDCHSSITVPPPPRKKVKSSINIDNAQTFGFEETKTKERVDPFRKSAAELLDAAEKSDEEEQEPNYETPDIRQWLMNVFGIFIDPGVLAHWLGLSLIGSVPALIAFSFESQILVLALFPGAILLSVLIVACAFAILLSVANNEDTVTEWPTMDPVGWFELMFLALAAAALAAIPAWSIGHIFFKPGLMAIALTMFSVYALFPFFILSMLDMQSVLMPFSPEVARSASRCQESWGGFYFSSGLLFAGLFLFFTSLSGASAAVQAALGIIATVGVTFTYFAMIGRLAYAIGQAVNDPPKKNELDRSTPAE